jgi:uncharacterized protein
MLEPTHVVMGARRKDEAIRTCPICRRAADDSPQNKAFPFCSHRCRAMDLGRWLSETYRIPGESVEREDEKVSSPEGRPEDFES